MGSSTVGNPYSEFGGSQDEQTAKPSSGDPYAAYGGSQEALDVASIIKKPKANWTPEETQFIHDQAMQSADKISRQYVQSLPLMLGGGLQNVAEREAPGIVGMLKRLWPGAKTAAPEPTPTTPQADALGNIPVKTTPETPSTVVPQVDAKPLPQNPQALPVHGDSTLRQILTGQDNANLLKIAKSRGINVTKEAQLKAGKADSMLINKIVDDFSPDELQEISDKFVETQRFKRDLSKVGPEAYKTLSLQTYFPDLKLPKALLNRTAQALNPK